MSDTPRPLPPKKEVALALLEGPSMFVHLDPRKAGVRVPPGFINRAELVLQLGLNMAIPIPDLKIDEAGVTCTLSFGGKPFWCKLPWDAVYALVGEDGKGMIWPGDVPPEVAAQMQRAAPAPARPARRPRPKLAPAESSEPADASEGPASPRRARREPEGAPVEARTEGSAAPGGGASEAHDPSARTESQGKRPRRELPPYLRVIK